MALFTSIWMSRQKSMQISCIQVRLANTSPKRSGPCSGQNRFPHKLHSLKFLYTSPGCWLKKLFDLFGKFSIKNLIFFAILSVHYRNFKYLYNRHGIPDHHDTTPHPVSWHHRIGPMGWIASTPVRTRESCESRDSFLLPCVRSVSYTHLRAHE